MQSSTEKQVKRSLENVERQLKVINDWQSWLDSDEGKNYARPEEEELLFKQINEIVDKNIFYGWIFDWIIGNFIWNNIRNFIFNICRKY